MANFDTGNVVCLKSNERQKMCVEEVMESSDGVTWVHVVWFDENNNLFRDKFRATALTIIEDDD